MCSISDLHRHSLNFEVMAKGESKKALLEQGKNQRHFYLNPDEKERLLSIKILLEQNPSIRYTIPQLSKKALMNEFKLKKGFKFLYGNSIHDFHIEVRMKEAKRLMNETNETLEEIARKTGYQYLSSFITIFRKLYNTTPATFRRKNRQ
jgi:AraC family transcriptional activator of pyochelin receptor